MLVIRLSAIFAATTNKDFILDDGTDDSPQVIMQDAGGFSFILQKMDAGEVDIISTEGVINIKPVADPHDFGCFSIARGNQKCIGKRYC